MVTESTVVTPKEATEEDLLFVHTQKYLDDLNVNISLNYYHQHFYITLCICYLN